MLPAERAGEVDQLARGERRLEPLARLVVDALPVLLGDRRVLAQEMAHDAVPFRLPIPSDVLPATSRAACGGTLDRGLLGRLAVLDDVAVLEQDPLRDLAPQRDRAQQELHVHAEVLELLALRVAHDRVRFAVRLDREALLIPADRLGFLGQRRAEPGERARLGRELARRFVVLVGRHAGILPPREDLESATVSLRCRVRLA